MSYRRNSNNIFTDSESEQDANHLDSAPSSPSSQSSSVASSTGILPSPSPLSHPLQSETDDEIILSPQGSLSPIHSAEEDDDEEEEVQQPQKHRQQPQHNYYDPDLYCLRRSNRRKEKESVSICRAPAVMAQPDWHVFLQNEEESEEMTYTTDEEAQDSSSDDDYGASVSTGRKKRSSNRQQLKKKGSSSSKRVWNRETWPSGYWHARYSHVWYRRWRRPCR